MLIAFQLVQFLLFRLVLFQNFQLIIGQEFKHSNGKLCVQNSNLTNFKQNISITTSIKFIPRDAIGSSLTVFGVAVPLLNSAFYLIKKTVVFAVIGVASIVLFIFGITVLLGAKVLAEIVTCKCSLFLPLYVPHNLI